jgi:phage shock protein A
MDDLMIIGAWPLVFAASYALCWFTEVNWRDRKITELEAEVDRQDDRIEQLRGVLRGVRLELNAREAELSTLKATAITRDAKGHFTKVKA